MVYGNIKRSVLLKVKRKYITHKNKHLLLQNTINIYNFWILNEVSKKLK